MIVGVSPETAAKFYSVWHPQGGVNLVPPHTFNDYGGFEFAADFANFTLNQFIARAQAGAQAALEIARQQEQPKVVLTGE